MKDHTHEPLPADALLEHASFLRGLAFRLLKDDHHADDVVQEALMAGLERPPQRRGNLRAWLATVVRNLSALRRRRDGRRSRRERRAAARPAAPSPVQTAARLEAQRRVVESVEALDEPYRTVVVLRYFDDLDAATIAERLGVPVPTVRTRLRRAHEKLRTQLDQVYGGDRRAWSIALLPLVPQPTPPAPAGANGGSEVSIKTILGLAAAAVVLTAIPLVARGTQRTNDRAVGTDTAAHATADPAAAPSGDPSGAVADSNSSTTDQSEALASGQVRSTTGKAIRNGSVAVYLLLGTRRQFAGRAAVDNGTYRLPLHQIDSLPPLQRLVTRVEAVATAPGHHAAFLEGGLLRDHDGGSVRFDFELRPGANVRGRLLGRSGEPLPGGLVFTVADDADDAESYATLDEKGQFEIPILKNGRYWICGGHESIGGAYAGPRTLEKGRDLALGDLRVSSGTTLDGVLVDPDGKPLPHVELVAAKADLGLLAALIQGPVGQAGPTSFNPGRNTALADGLPGGRVRTDEHGRFSFPGLQPGSYLVVPDLVIDAGNLGALKALFTKPHPTGSTARIVFDKPILRVQARDDRGEVLHGFPISVTLGKGDDITGTGSSGEGDGAWHDSLAAPGTAWGARADHAEVEADTARGTLPGHGLVVATLVPKPAAGVGSLRVRVLDESGQPVREFWAALERERNAADPDEPEHVGLLRAAEARDGTCALRAAAGRYELEIAPAGSYLRVTREIEIEAGRTTPVVLRTRLGGHVAVTLAGGDGIVPPYTLAILDATGRTVVVEGTMFEHPRARKLSFGAKRAYGAALAPGRYDLEVQVDGYRPAKRSLFVRASETTDVAIALEAE